MIRGLGLSLCGALLAASCSSGLETPADTLQSETLPGSDFGYVIDAVPDGYELCLVDTQPGLSVRAEGVSLFVYGDGDLNDPYQGSLYGVAVFDGGPLATMELGETVDVEVDGVAARLGDISGLLLASLPATAGRLLTYNTSDARTIQLAVRGDDEVDLVELAGSVVISDEQATLSDSGLPNGFVSLGDLYQLDADAEFLFTLDYRVRNGSGSGFEDQITLLGTSGDESLLNAFRFRAGLSEVRKINGWPGVVAEVGSDGQGPQVVSWLVDGEVLLRVFSTVLSLEALSSVAQSVRRVGGGEWVELRDTFDPTTCQR
jgi:hypothetical protein